MPQVSDTIPENLQADVEAALTWFNQTQSETFSVTGIVDADLALAASGPRDLKLVLCGGDVCLQESFRVARSGDAIEVSQLAPITAPVDDQTDELDPPPGALRGWIDSVTQKHEFTVLLFYRGFW